MVSLWGSHSELLLGSGHLLRQGVESGRESWLDHRNSFMGHDRSKKGQNTFLNLMPNLPHYMLGMWKYCCVIDQHLMLFVQASYTEIQFTGKVD